MTSVAASPAFDFSTIKQQYKESHLDTLICLRACERKVSHSIMYVTQKRITFWNKPRTY
jgi:hypothetical protein